MITHVRKEIKVLHHLLDTTYVNRNQGEARAFLYVQYKPVSHLESFIVSRFRRRSNPRVFCRAEFDLVVRVRDSDREASRGIHSSEDHISQGIATFLAYAERIIEFEYGRN